MIENCATVKSCWEDYERNALPETRRAFYAGFLSLMRIIIYIGESDMDETEGAEWLSALEKELETFGNQGGK